MEIEAHRTPIQTFYAGLSVFITGGTGFLGQILIEKLLRSCPDISTIYLLIRSKQGKSPKSRLDEIFEKTVYDRMKKEVPNFRKKVVPIIGDLDNEEFGLSENDKITLINEVSIIFHMAAYVRFDHNIKMYVVANINSVDTILKLAKQMPHLKSLVHVSTAYANTHVEHIEERFYTYPINHKDLIMFTRNLSESEIEKKISGIITRWPNIYTFTKAIAEGLLRNESEDLPIGIFRPAIVLSTASEPLIGWINNMFGPVSLVMTTMLGISRFHICNLDLKTNIVPVDLTINALIVSAWDVFNQCRKGKDMLIYNYVSPIDAPTWNEYYRILTYANKMYPSNKAMYYPYMIISRRKILYRICVWLGHFFPALLMDAINICINRSPRMWKLYLKIDKVSKMIEPFTIKEWSFSTDNVQAMWDRLNEKEQQLFNFSMMGFDWTKYFIDHYNGIRLYLLNEDDSTLEMSRIKYRIFYWIHQTIKIAFVFAFCGLSGSFLKKYFYI